MHITRNTFRVLEVFFYLFTTYYMWHLGVTPTERLPWGAAIGYGFAHFLAAVVVPIAAAIALFLYKPERKDGWLLFWAAIGFWLIYAIDIYFRHYLILRKAELVIYVGIMFCIKAVVIFSRLRKKIHHGENDVETLFYINYKPIMRAFEMLAFFLVATLVCRHGFKDSSDMTFWHGTALFACNALIILGFSFVAAFVTFWMSKGNRGMLVAWATVFWLLHHLVIMEYFGEPLIREWEFWLFVSVIAIVRACMMAIWFLNWKTDISHVAVERQ